MPLTPADVRNKQFSTTRLRPGYDEEEVDAFLDEVEAELDRLIQENEELRAKLAEVMRGGKSAVPALSSPLSDPKQDMMVPEPVMPERRQPEPVMMGGMPHIEDNMDTAARVLSLAQQTADQAIADARREADETLGRARREADEVLTKARRQAEQITGDARARAESLERDAQERHRQAMGSLVQTREELERRVDDLRAFEREYRSQAQGLPRRTAPRPGGRRHRQRYLPDHGRSSDPAGVDAGRAGCPGRRPQRRSGPEPVRHARSRAALGWFPYDRGSALARPPVGAVLGRCTHRRENACDRVQCVSRRGRGRDACRGCGHQQAVAGLPGDRRERSLPARAGSRRDHQAPRAVRKDAGSPARRTATRGGPGSARS